MPFTIISFVLIVGGLTLVTIIIVRRFPQIALLEVDELPQEIDAKRKKKILEEKYNKQLKFMHEKVSKLLIPLGKMWEKIQKKFRAHMQQTYIKHAQALAKKKKQPKSAPPPPEAVAALLKDAETQLLMEHYDRAEEKFIEVIRFAPRTIEAYRGLGRLYFKQKQYDQALETYNFILKLDPKDGRAYNRLGMIAVAKEDWKSAVSYYKKAIEYNPDIALRHYDLGFTYESMQKNQYAMRAYERAVLIEPMNPKYLDAYVTSAILCNNQEIAQQAYEQLKIANPENKKLASIKRTIRDMKKKTE